jgi:uncharacterized protein (TIGR00159 family)
VKDLAVGFNFEQFLQNVRPIDFVDWASVVLLLYFVYQLIRKTRAVWLTRGALILGAIYVLSYLADLKLLTFILDKVSVGLFVAIIIVFQPELRKFLEKLGRGDFITALIPERPSTMNNPSVEELLIAVKELSQQRTGALIVLEGTPIQENLLTDGGVRLDAQLKHELLLSLFHPKTPLHDGAVVLRDWRIEAAGVILPMTDQVTSRKLGTRHRAGIGVTEQTDSRCIIVSEETGSISFAEGGQIYRPLTVEQLKDLLNQRYSPERESLTSTMMPNLSLLTKRFLSPSSNSRTGE